MYRIYAQLACILLQTILSQRGLIDESLIEEQEFEGIVFTLCLNPVHQDYFARVFSALKSVLRAQGATVIEMQFSGSHIERWQIEMSEACDYNFDEFQALLNDVTSAMSVLDPLEKANFRVCFKMRTELRVPKQCECLRKSVALTDGTTTRFRDIRFIRVRMRNEPGKMK